MRAEGSVEMQQPIQTNCVCSISLHPGWKRTFWIKQVGLNEAPGNGREQAAPVPYTLTFAFRRTHHLSLVVVSTQQLQKRWQAGCGLDVDMLVHVIGSVRCWLQAEMWLCSWWIAGFTPFTDRPEAEKCEQAVNGHEGQMFDVSTSLLTRWKTGQSVLNRTLLHTHKQPLLELLQLMHTLLLRVPFV